MQPEFYSSGQPWSRGALGGTESRAGARRRPRRDAREALATPIHLLLWGATALAVLTHVRHLPPASALLAAAAFALLGAMTQWDRVAGLRYSARRLAPAFLFAACLTAGIIPAAAAALATYLHPLLLRRHVEAGRGWTAASVILAVAAGATPAVAAAARLRDLHDVMVLATGMIVCLLVMHLLQALGSWLGVLQGVPTERALRPTSLSLDALLLCLGATLSVLWSVSPWALILAVLPLILLNRAFESSYMGEAAISDPKTGLYNLRFFRLACRQEIERAARSGAPLAVLMADLDLLRDVNTRYGHLTGDEVLRQVAALVRSNVRGMDVAARFGGEEFAILLPDSSKRKAYLIAERLRAAVASETCRPPGRLGLAEKDAFKVSVSVGVAAYPDDGDSDETLLAAADRALYAAKAAGRDRVVVCGEPEGAAPQALALSS